MADFLVFQLYGALASWGDIAVGEYRPSQGQPSKSAVTGLLAAALGIARADEAYTTRRQELLSDRLSLNTILSQRDYRTDAFYQIAVWPIDKDAPYSLEDFYYALRRPKFSLYLGRRSCPAGLPLYPRMMPDVTLKQAFDNYPLDKAEPWLKQMTAPGLIRYVWEQEGLKTEEAGMLRVNPVVTVTTQSRKQQRHDVVMQEKQRIGYPKLPEMERPPLQQLVQQSGINWLRARTDSNGFSIEPGQVVADGYQQHRSRIKRQRRLVCYSSVDFQGILTIINTERFRKALFSGIGKSKAFGCGLLLIKRYPG